MIYDISMNINETIQVYKNIPEKKPLIRNASNFENASVFESVLEMNLHTGTHIDFPKHILKKGMTSETFQIESCLGEAFVVDLTNVENGISRKDLESFGIRENDFVLLKTRNSHSEEFNPDFVFLALDGAKYLAGKLIRGVGIDSLGIERSQEGHPTHHVLLEQGIHILEGLRLKGVPQDRYELLCLPLKIDGVEALPARVYLRK